MLVRLPLHPRRRQHRLPRQKRLVWTGRPDPLAADGLRGHPHPRVVRRGRDIPDISRSFSPHLRAGDGGDGGTPVGTPMLGRSAGVPAGGKRPDHQPGLLRRLAGGHHGEAGLPPEPVRQHHLPEPHFRGRQQPPLQHGGLSGHRPHAGHGGGLPHPMPRGARPGHPHHSGRRIQPYRLQQPVFQRQRLLPGAGGGAEQGLPLFPVV